MLFLSVVMVDTNQVSQLLPKFLHIMVDAFKNEICNIQELYTLYCVKSTLADTGFISKHLLINTDFHFLTYFC